VIGRLALGAMLALGAAGAMPPSAAPLPRAPEAASAQRPAPLQDRFGWNAFERTRTGLKRLEEGESGAAAEAFDTALRLRPDDALASFNAGTGRLAAGRPDAPAPLEEAARAASPELAPDAWYNLGNARLAAGDARGAVEAYAETLRRASDRLEAKKNLELALRALEAARQRQPPPPSGADAKPDAGRGAQDDDAEPRAAQGETGQDGQPDASASDPVPQRDPGGETGERGEPADASSAVPPASDPGQRAASGSPEDGQSARQRVLRDFRDQPDLDAEQAAALLAAVEDLERQQRRARSLERARARGSGEKDW
jgi:tetratricopeptide (TPR) repeat protein